MDRSKIDKRSHYINYSQTSKTYLTVVDQVKIIKKLMSYISSKKSGISAEEMSTRISIAVEGALMLPLVTAQSRITLFEFECLQSKYGDIIRQQLIIVFLFVVRAISTTAVLRCLAAPYPNLAAIVIFGTTFVPVLYPVVGLLPWWLGDIVTASDVWRLEESNESGWNNFFVTNKEGIYYSAFFVRGFLLLVWALVILPTIEGRMQGELIEDKQIEDNGQRDTTGNFKINLYVTSLVVFSAWSVIGIRGIVYGPLLLLLITKVVSGGGTRLHTKTKSD